MIIVTRVEVFFFEPTRDRGCETIENQNVLPAFKGYKVGFGGQYGLQTDRVDSSAVGWEYYEKPAKHSSQTGKRSGPR
jgi:hypothetical protein